MSINVDKLYSGLQVLGLIILSQFLVKLLVRELGELKNQWGSQVSRLICEQLKNIE